MVLLLLTSVRTQLMSQWRATLPESAPNHFLINIQPEERDAIGAALVAYGVGAATFTPLVRARITARERPPGCGLRCALRARAT